MCMGETDEETWRVWGARPFVCVCWVGLVLLAEDGGPGVRGSMLGPWRVVNSTPSIEVVPLRGCSMEDMIVSPLGGREIAMFVDA